MEGREQSNKGWVGMHDVHTHTHTNAHTPMIEAGQPYTPPFQHNVQTIFSFYCTIFTPLFNSMDLHKMNTLMDRWLVCNHGNRDDHSNIGNTTLQ